MAKETAVALDSNFKLLLLSKILVAVEKWWHHVIIGIKHGCVCIVGVKLPRVLFRRGARQHPLEFDTNNTHTTMFDPLNRSPDNNILLISSSTVWAYKFSIMASCYNRDQTWLCVYCPVQHHKWFIVYTPASSMCSTTAFRVRQWLGAEQTPSHYLNQWWPRSMAHICVSRIHWVHYFTVWGIYMYIY